MNKYILICPYFGRLPDNIQLWLNSCAFNKDIDFLILTDDRTTHIVPNNVKIEYMTFDDLRNHIQSKFSFSISLSNPYKLCDYKPTYGFVFSDYIKGYEYWGNCDLDLIYGDLSKFLPKTKYDKISNLGHTTFYRNTDKINHAFMNESDSSISYKDIFSSDANFGFDEIGTYGIRHIFDRNNYSIFPLEKSVADMTTGTSNFRLSHYICEENVFKVEQRESIFTYENGHLFGWKIINSKINKEEYAYLHFQKRKMIDHRSNDQSIFIIGPHGFYDYQAIDINLFRQFCGKDKDFEWFRRKYKAFGNKMKRTKAIKKLSNKGSIK